MARTISQIAGDYGLSQTADTDPFANSESATLKTVASTLAEIQSQNEELATARGMGRSTFTDATNAKQTADVLAPVFTQFAQARTTNDLNKENFNRQVVGQGVTADINTASQEQAGTIASNLSSQNATQNVSAIGAQSAAQVAAIKTQGDIQSQQIAQQGSITSELSKQNQVQNIETIGAQGNVQQEALKTQAKFQSEQIAQQASANQQQAQVQGDIQKSVLGVQTAGDISKINSQYDNYIRAAEAAVATQMQNLPETLRLQVQAQKDILVDQLNVQRQAALTNVEYSVAASMLTDMLAGIGVGGALGGISKAVDKGLGGVINAK